MVKCPKCGCENYDVIYIEDYDYRGDSVVATVKVRCDDCDEEFWVKETFKFEKAECY